MSIKNLLPRKVAELTQKGAGKYEVTKFKDTFYKAIKECGDGQIMFIPIIGPYQTGKSSFLSVLLQNDHIEVGDSRREKTMGVDMIGPIDLNLLKRKYGVEANKKQNIKIFFVDTQGYGGYSCGSADENKINITRLISSFIPLSQVVILFTRSNVSSGNIDTMDTFFNLISSCDSLFNAEGMKLINVERLAGRVKNISYSSPSREKYNLISKYLSEVQTDRFKNIKIDGFYPYPNFNIDLEKPFDNLKNTDFANGFGYLMKDLFKTIDIASTSLSFDQERVKALFDYYLDSSSDESLKSFSSIARKNEDLKVLKKQISASFNNIIPKKLEIFTSRLKEKKKAKNYPFITDYKQYNDLLEDILREMRNIIARNYIYNNELHNLYEMDIKPKFISQCNDRVQEFEREMQEMQVSVSFSSIKEKIEKAIKQYIEEEIVRFKGRDRSKIDIKPFLTNLETIINDSLNELGQRTCFNSTVDKVRSLVEAHYQSKLSHLDACIDTRIKDNIKNRYSKLKDFLEIIVGIASLVVPVIGFILDIVFLFL